jgi:hypothetical protein
MAASLAELKGSEYACNHQNCAVLALISCNSLTNLTNLDTLSLCLLCACLHWTLLDCAAETVSLITNDGRNLIVSTPVLNIL